MKKIELHTYDAKAIKDNAKWHYDRIPKLMETIRQKEISLDGLYDRCKVLAIYEYILNRNEKECLKYIDYSMKALLGHFEQASYPGQEVEIEICGEKINVRGKESEDYKLGPMFWLEGIYMAIILRDKESILKFMNIPIQVMLNANMNDEELFMVFVFFLKNYLSSNKDTGELLIDAYKLTDPKLYEPERNLFIQNTITPQLELFISMIKDDQIEFDKDLEKALTRFKSFYNQMPKEEYGLMSFPFIAICILAKERGLKIEIESDYTPKFLIEGIFK